MTYNVFGGMLSLTQSINPFFLFMSSHPFCHILVLHDGNSSCLLVCCVDTDMDTVSATVETEDDSSDTEYIPDGKQSTGIFGLSYSAFTCFTYCT